MMTSNQNKMKWNANQNNDSGMLSWKKFGRRSSGTEYVVFKTGRKSSYFRRFWTWILVQNVEIFCVQKCWSKTSTSDTLTHVHTWAYCKLQSAFPLYHKTNMLCSLHSPWSFCYWEKSSLNIIFFQQWET